VIIAIIAKCLEPTLQVMMRSYFNLVGSPTPRS